jgi:hypothetical protein
VARWAVAQRFSFDELANRYLEQHAPLKKKPVSRAADERILRLYLRPVLGHRKLAEIGVRDITELQVGMQNKPVQANRALAVLSKMFSLAERWDLRPPGSIPRRVPPSL